MLALLHVFVIRAAALTPRPSALPVPSAPLEFNFQKVTEQSKDNPVFYVQYAHARICSVIRNLEDYKFDLDLNDFDNCNYEQLKEDGELFLLKKIMNYSSIIETSASQ